jgi:hypothetical protein
VSGFIDTAVQSSCPLRVQSQLKVKLAEVGFSIIHQFGPFDCMSLSS